MSAVTAASDDEMHQQIVHLREQLGVMAKLLRLHIEVTNNVLETEDFEDGGQALRDLVRQSEAAVRGVLQERVAEVVA